MTNDSTVVEPKTIQVAVFKYEFKTPAPQPIHLGTPKRIPQPDITNVLYGFWVIDEDAQGSSGEYDYGSMKRMANDLAELRRTNKRGNEFPMLSYVGLDKEPRLKFFVEGPLDLLPTELSKLEGYVDKAFKEHGETHQWPDNMRL